MLPGVLDDSLFNDVIDADFITPYNVPLTIAPAAKKPDLLAQIDAAKNEDQLDSNGQLLTCNKIWYVLPTLTCLKHAQILTNFYRERLQDCPKVQNGDFDLDGLCSELQKKAKCSGTGAVVGETDFHNVMRKYLGSSEPELQACKLKYAKKDAAEKEGRSNSTAV